MSESDRRGNHDYYECLRCGRTVLVLYDDPKPGIDMTCDDGHMRLRMNPMHTDN